MYRKYMHAYGEMLWLWASHDDNCPSFTEARGLATNAHKSPDDMQKLGDMRTKIMTADYGPATLFAPFMQEIDTLAVKWFDTYEGVLGTRDEEYLSALANYRAGVVKIIKPGLMASAVTSEDKIYADRVAARIFLALTPVDSQPVPLPLMTGKIMDMIWSELESAKEGYTEVRFLIGV